MYRVELNKIFNGSVCIFEAIGNIRSFLEIDKDIIFCYVFENIDPNEYMKIPYAEARARILRIDPSGKIMWRISGPSDKEFNWVYIDKNGKYRAATSGYEIYYFDPETGKTQGWDYE
jgi:hypothetical protein